MSITEKWADGLAERFGTELEKVRAEIRAGLAETRNAMRVGGHRSAPLLPNALASTSGGRLVGWSIRETSGTNPVVVTLYDGRDVTADVLAVVPLPAGGAATASLGLPGVSFGDGLYVGTSTAPGSATAGAAAGAVWFGSVD